MSEQQQERRFYIEASNGNALGWQRFPVGFSEPIEPSQMIAQITANLKLAAANPKLFEQLRAEGKISAMAYASCCRSVQTGRKMDFRLVMEAAGQLEVIGP